MNAKMKGYVIVTMEHVLASLDIRVKYATKRVLLIGGEQIVQENAPAKMELYVIQ